MTCPSKLHEAWTVANIRRVNFTKNTRRSVISATPLCLPNMFLGPRQFEKTSKFEETSKFKETSNRQKICFVLWFLHTVNTASPWVVSLWFPAINKIDLESFSSNKEILLGQKKSSGEQLFRCLNTRRNVTNSRKNVLINLINQLDCYCRDLKLNSNWNFANWFLAAWNAFEGKVMEVLHADGRRLIEKSASRSCDTKPAFFANWITSDQTAFAFTLKLWGKCTVEKSNQICFAGHSFLCKMDVAPWCY